MRLHVNAPACKINIKLHGQCIVNKNNTVWFEILEFLEYIKKGQPGATTH